MKDIKEILEFSIINIDKPSGPTSFWVDSYVKKELGLKKTSHFGTLDPKVTGVLPIALNRACKLLGYFIVRDKVYVGVMHLHKPISRKVLESEMKKLTGKIKQLPPIKSRVKREIREREVKKFDIIEYDEEGRNVLFYAEVQAGTYIRKLCDDLGKSKKIDGAHMTELRRVKSSIFEEKDSVTLYEFKKAVEEYKKGNEESLRKMLIPAEEAIKEILPIVQIKKEALKHLYYGSPVFNKYLARRYKIENNERVAVFLDKKFIETARVTNEERAGIFARPEFVLN